MKHQFIVECDSEKNFNSKSGEQQLRDHIAGRLWEMDGIVHGTAVCRIVPAECVVVSRAEYESLQAKVQHYESQPTA